MTVISFKRRIFEGHPPHNLVRSYKIVGHHPTIL